MAEIRHLPHGHLLLKGMALTPDRLRTGTKVAVSVPVLRAIISAGVAHLPFDPEFYLETYADVRDAYESGQIVDLRAHFDETGYFEGRLGEAPDFDVQFYEDTYPDVTDAIRNGKVKSGLEHYLRAGSFEGRYANARDKEAGRDWDKVLRPVSDGH